MQPAQLTAASFAGYPPAARALALRQLALLQELPLVLVPILLRELIAFDWKLPAEQRQLTRQFAFLAGLSSTQRTAAMQGFRSLPLPAELAATNWVADPSGFMERLTAWLWSAHRMESFRGLADTYAHAADETHPDPPPTLPRLGLVVIGAGMPAAPHPLFRKLRPAGVHLTHIAPDDGFPILLAEATRRANLPANLPAHLLANLPVDKALPAPPDAASQSSFLHWYIEGGATSNVDPLTHVSYASLEQPRALLLQRIQQAIASGGMGPEELRSLLARMKPQEIGLGPANIHPAIQPASQTTKQPAPHNINQDTLNHFQLSLLTEGAGTQIFATTFVQWAARECVRRAQPETLLVRYAPRRQASTMNDMLSGSKPTGTDPAGSLIDADLGAYYTWLNLRRLSGSDQLRFLVWFEGGHEAIAIGPGLPHGTTSDSPLHMDQALALLA